MVCQGQRDKGSFAMTSKQDFHLTVQAPGFCWHDECKSHIHSPFNLVWPPNEPNERNPNSKQMSNL